MTENFEKKKKIKIGFWQKKCPKFEIKRKIQISCNYFNIWEIQ